MMLTDLTIKDFMAQIAGDKLLPAGRCTAALNATLAAALTQRAIGLLATAQEDNSEKEQAEGLAQNLEMLCEEFMMCMDRELDAYQELLAAYQLPELSPDEIKTKDEQIQKFVLISAMIPYDIAEMTMRMMDFIVDVSLLIDKNEKANMYSAISLARCAVQGAVCVVAENVKQLKSKQVIDDLLKKSKEIEELALSKEQELLLKL